MERNRIIKVVEEGRLRDHLRRVAARLQDYHSLIMLTLYSERINEMNTACTRRRKRHDAGRAIIENCQLHCC